MQERTNLLREIEAKTQPPVQTVDHDSQTDDRQHEKLVQFNNKLKRALQSVKDKIHRLVADRPDLFDGVGEDASERLDHLIATVENQAAEVNVLQTERNQATEEHQRQIKEFQRYMIMDANCYIRLNFILDYYSLLESSQFELENERQVKMQAPVFTASLSAPSTNDIRLHDLNDLKSFME